LEELRLRVASHKNLWKKGLSVANKSLFSWWQFQINSLKKGTLVQEKLEDLNRLDPSWSAVLGK